MSEEKKEVIVPEKFQSLVSTIEKLSVLDLAELVKVLEEKFGVSASAPVVAMAAGAAAASAPAEEKTSFDVEMTASGDNKIDVIKVVKEITGLGLKEAKDMVDAAPAIVKKGAKKEEDEELRKKLQEAGATVNLK